VIPQANIVEWSNGVPWPTIEQVEQDLLLSRLIIEIAEDPYLGKELAFRLPFRTSDDRFTSPIAHW
jgi:hypothetical protein